jgi:NAD(P)-dependent dehydrogenase (short-subunit alcohol dehydrogenase family)
MIKTLKGKKILVTGADGFIGRALMKRLRESGALVTGLDLKDADICDLTVCLSSSPAANLIWCIIWRRLAMSPGPGKIRRGCIRPIYWGR